MASPKNRLKYRFDDSGVKSNKFNKSSRLEMRTYCPVCLQIQYLFENLLRPPKGKLKIFAGAGLGRVEVFLAQALDNIWHHHQKRSPDAQLLFQYIIENTFWSIYTLYCSNEKTRFSLNYHPMGPHNVSKLFGLPEYNSRCPKFYLQK